MGVNYLAVLVAAVVAFLVGWLWYSPILFGNLWMKLSGIKNGITQKEIKKSKKKGMAETILIGFISTLVMTYVFAYLMDILSYTDAGSGAMLGFLLWLGFLATTMLGSVLWDGKPAALYLINTLHYLIALVVIGAILGGWA